MYLIPPTTTTTTTTVLPRQNLVAFLKVDLTPSSSTTVTLHALAEDLLTATDNGERVLLPGRYTVAVGGHLPHDPEAQRAGLEPVLTQTIDL